MYAVPVSLLFHDPLHRPATSERQREEVGVEAFEIRQNVTLDSRLDLLAPVVAVAPPGTNGADHRSLFDQHRSLAQGLRACRATAEPSVIDVKRVPRRSRGW